MRAHAGAAFSALDEERQASMADEGGVSGALMEVDGEAQRSLAQPTARRRIISWRLALGLLVVGCAVALVFKRSPSR